MSFVAQRAFSRASSRYSGGCKISPLCVSPVNAIETNERVSDFYTNRKCTLALGAALQNFRLQFHAATCAPLLHGEETFTGNYTRLRKLGMHILEKCDFRSRFLRIMIRVTIRLSHKNALNDETLLEGYSVCVRTDTLR